jgi:hypothetical protein
MIFKIMQQISYLLSLFPDIDSDVEGKLVSRLLESATQSLDFRCAFTVVCDNISAIESTEHCPYDLIMIKEDSPLFTIVDMIGIFVKLGIQIPVILTCRKNHSFVFTSQHGIQLAQSVYVLKHPYSTDQLCDSITKALTGSPIDPDQNRKIMDEMAIREIPFSQPRLLNLSSKQFEMEFDETKANISKKSPTKQMSARCSSANIVEYGNKNEYDNDNDGDNETLHNKKRKCKQLDDKGATPKHTSELSKPKFRSAEIHSLNAEIDSLSEIIRSGTKIGKEDGNSTATNSNKDTDYVEGNDAVNFLDNFEELLDVYTTRHISDITDKNKNVAFETTSTISSDSGNLLQLPGFDFRSMSP